MLQRRPRTSLILKPQTIESDGQIFIACRTDLVYISNEGNNKKCVGAFPSPISQDLLQP
jgi:hypothetical protein